MKVSNLPSVLFMPSNNANFVEMHHVARFLVDHQMAIPVFLVENYSATSHIDKYNTDGYCFINKHSLISKFLCKASLKVKYLRGRVAEDQKRADLLNLLRTRLRQCEKIIEKYRPISVVLRGDRHLGKGWELPMIKTCRSRSIPRIVINFAHPAFPDGLLTHRNNAEYDADNYPHLKRKFPVQVRFDKKSQRNVLYRQGYKTEVLSELGLLPENPWVMGGSGSSVILIDGEANKKQYISHGVPEEKIVVTGNCAHDNLYGRFINRTQLKEKLFEKYSFDSSKKLILLALVQLAEEKFMSIEEAKEELSLLFQKINLIEANILVSLHPRMRRIHYQDIIDRYGLHAASEPLSEIMPAADLFTASFSSTVQWAILCEVPVVIYDFYNFINPANVPYSKFNCVIKAKGENYTMIMRKIICDESYAKELKLKYQEVRHLYSKFDGLCTDRIAKHVTLLQK